MALWRITLVSADRAALKGGQVQVPGRLKIIAAGPTTGSDDAGQRIILVEGERADAEVVRDAFTAVEGVAGGVELAPDGRYLMPDGRHVDVRDGRVESG
ncbi:MAG TPA: hypothetical protein VGL23_10945 [Chloroflexota bacterium]|jgi:hypothetical protein